MMLNSSGYLKLEQRQHIEDQLEGILYDWENSLTLERQNKDIAFYRSLIEKYKGNENKLLELACGTGRITIPLWEMGYTIVGLDLSHPRLRCAEAKVTGDSNIQFVQGDMTNFEVATSPFDFVFIPYSSFLLLSTFEQRLNCLECVAKTLNESGTLVIDISPNFLNHEPHNDKRKKIAGYCEALETEVAYYESVIQNYVLQETTFHKLYQFNSPHITISEFSCTEVWYTLKPDEMRWLVSLSPFRIEEIYGTYDGELLYHNGKRNLESYKNIYCLKKK